MILVKQVNHLKASDLCSGKHSVVLKLVFYLLQPPNLSHDLNAILSKSHMNLFFSQVDGHILIFKNATFLKKKMKTRKYSFDHIY